MHKMTCVIAPLVLCTTITTWAQSNGRPEYFDRARIRHSDSGLVLQAYDSIPLFQALYALRLEYGWKVSWESAPGYSHFDLVDDTDPRWRASHPDAKGATRPAGGSFTALLPELKERSDPATERDILTKLIEEYNQTDNPGRYILTSASDGELVVVGAKVRDDNGAFTRISPLLDTPLTFPKTDRSVYDTIRTIIAAVESATGSKMIFSVASSSLFRQTHSAVGGERVPARTLLMHALASTGQQLQYDLFFNADLPAYILNVSPVVSEANEVPGQRKLVLGAPVAKP